MAVRLDGNAAKRAPWVDVPAPWRAWAESSRAERAMRWIETFFVPPKGFGAGRPSRLAPFQKGWLRAVYDGGLTSAAMLLLLAATRLGSWVLWVG